jgi:Na+/H+-dicarboxylate symporter
MFYLRIAMQITPLNTLAVHVQRLINSQLWIKVIIGIVLGIGVGIFLNPSTNIVEAELSSKISNWLDVPGHIFLKLVQMIMIPLIFTSIITGIVSNQSSNLKTMGLRLLIYFMFTTAVAITIGSIVTIIMAPGDYVYSLGGLPISDPSTVIPTDQAVGFSNIPELIVNLIPNNPLEAMLTGEMLGVVIFTVIIGVAMTQLKPEQGQPLIQAATAIQKVCMIVVSWAMLLVPYAVFGMIAALLARIGIDILLGLGYYILVVLVGLLAMLIFYLIILNVFTGYSPTKFLKAIREPQLLAFSTASSMATMPISMKTADTKLGVSSNISDFVVPVGASINMDGTAIFQCVSALFLAQAYGMDLQIIDLLLITVTVVAASIGTPGIPGGGVIILASVLQSVGIPTDGLIVIIGIDRILGMFRTSINVTGDLVACVIFNKWFGATQTAK